MEQVIIVDEQDNMLGVMDKMEAHITGTLHRAVSVFIFNSAGDFLLQRRAVEKYHSGGQWSNTCCSHPRPDETAFAAAHRRLHEEMGMEADLTYAFNFVYRAEFSNELTEYEYDHVFFGVSDQVPVPNNDEVAEYRYMNIDVLIKDMQNYPNYYTEWFKLCLQHIKTEHISKMLVAK
ncbi:MAG: isopentenyl-diphosphate Delta-isomerase [Sphingobacteriaceae bacterium]|nr:MAG: isopentenyl-diphosphate Delta-isomerase [Sphingobacteriaceae bacterium]